MGLKTYNFCAKQVRLTVIFCLVSYSAFAQNEKLLEAQELMQVKQFHHALEIYNTISNTSDKTTLLNKAICCIETNQADCAKNILNTLPEKNASDTDVLLVKAYFLQTLDEYRNAIDAYKLVLKKTKSKHPQLLHIRNQIKKCRQAMKVKAQPELAFIENLGDAVNTFHDDFGAVASPTIKGRFYFSSNRFTGLNQKMNTGPTNIYIAQSTNGLISGISSFDKALNTAGQESILDINADGSHLLFHQQIKGANHPQIRQKRFEADPEKLSSPVDFNSKIKGNLGDNYIHIHSDTSYVYSSRRIEGKGGYDIYMIKFKDGHWYEPVNLGNVINTTSDEISPFLTVDGQQLYFSSNRKESIGGYDIFYSEYNDDIQDWLPPKNIGFPVNSIKDDLYYRLDVSGHSASFSSDRIGTIGGLDLYAAYLKNNNVHQIESDGTIAFLRDHSSKILSQSDQNNDSELIATKNNNKSAPDETFPIKALFFDSSDKLVYGKQKEYLEQLIQFLQNHSNYVLEVQSHTTDEGESTLELYSSIRRTDKLIDYLRNNRIPDSQIIIKGFGNYFPLNPSFVRLRIDAKEQMEKRIHLALIPIRQIKESIEFIENETTRRIKNLKYKNYLKTIQDLSYSIQIAETKQLYNNSQINEFDQVKIEKLNERFIYSVGAYQTVDQAQKALNDLNPIHFQQVKIIAYLDGLRIESQNVLELSDIHSDLNNYLRYLNSKE